jgi:hypothetical protein
MWPSYMLQRRQIFCKTECWSHVSVFNVLGSELENDQRVVRALACQNFTSSKHDDAATFSTP